MGPFGLRPCSSGVRDSARTPRAAPPRSARPPRAPTASRRRQGSHASPSSSLCTRSSRSGCWSVVDHVARRCGAAGSRGRLARATSARAKLRPANGRLASAACGLHAHGPAAGLAPAAAHRHVQLGSNVAAPGLALGEGHQRVPLLARVVRHHDEVQRRRSQACRQHGRRGVAPSSAVLEPLREAIGHRRGPEVGRALHRRACCRRRVTGKGAHRAESTLVSRRKRRPLRRPWALGRTPQRPEPRRPGALLASFGEKGKASPAFRPRHASLIQRLVRVVERRLHSPHLRARTALRP